MTSLPYKELTARNSGYISSATQEKMRTTRLLIAGCGIGSSLAICAARAGFENFILIDGDTISQTNLNRQFYNVEDIGAKKVDALKNHILKINPDARVETIPENLSSDNIAGIMSRSDLIFDTIDFLDLPSILMLHGAAKMGKKPIFTALSVGFGGLVWFFPPGTPYDLPTILSQDMPSPGVDNQSAEATYADVFGQFIKRLVPYMDADVVMNIQEVLSKMKDRQPCPASQTAVGSFGLAAMASSMIIQFLAGQEIVSSPSLVLHSFVQHKTQIINILDC